nr:hypothetical protein [Mycoplasmopsis bovis]
MKDFLNKEDIHNIIMKKIDIDLKIRYKFKNDLLKIRYWMNKQW